MGFKRRIERGCKERRKQMRVFGCEERISRTGQRKRGERSSVRN